MHTRRHDAEEVVDTGINDSKIEREHDDEDERKYAAEYTCDRGECVSEYTAPAEGTPHTLDKIGRREIRWRGDTENAREFIKRAHAVQCIEICRKRREERGEVLKDSRQKEEEYAEEDRKERDINDDDRQNARDPFLRKPRHPRLDRGADNDRGNDIEDQTPELKEKPRPHEDEYRLYDRAGRDGNGERAL